MSKEEENPWKTKSSKVIYENPWIKLREDEVIRPDGNPGIYGLIEPKKVATGVIAINDEGQMVLVGQFRYATNCYSWEIVEGGAEPNETPLEGAKRELKEEAGLEAATWEALGGEFHLSNCFTSEVARIYLAKDLKDVGANPDGTEKLALKWVALEQALKLVLDGTITDAVSVIGILLTEKRLGCR